MSTTAKKPALLKQKTPEKVVEPAPEPEPVVEQASETEETKETSEQSGDENGEKNKRKAPGYKYKVNFENFLDTCVETTSSTGKISYIITKENYDAAREFLSVVPKEIKKGCPAFPNIYHEYERLKGQEKDDDFNKKYVGYTGNYQEDKDKSEIKDSLSKIIEAKKPEIIKQRNEWYDTIGKNDDKNTGKWDYTKGSFETKTKKQETKNIYSSKTGAKKA